MGQETTKIRPKTRIVWTNWTHSAAGGGVWRCEQSRRLRWCSWCLFCCFFVHFTTGVSSSLAFRLGLHVGFGAGPGFKLDLQLWSEDKTGFRLWHRAEAGEVLDFGVTCWLRSGAAVRFGATVEARNGWRRRNWEGCSWQRRNRWRRKRRSSSSGGSLLPEGR